MSNSIQSDLNTLIHQPFPHTQENPQSYGQTSDVQFEEIQDTFETAKKKRGFIARFLEAIIIPKLKNEQKTQNVLDKFQKGENTKEDAEKAIEKYENTNFNRTEIITDTLASCAAMGVGFIGKKLKELKNIFMGQKYNKHIMVATAATSIFAGVATKLGLKKIDSLGAEKTETATKTEDRGIISGAIDGVSGFISTLNPMLVPVGIVLNAFTRYARDKKDDITLPSISDFTEKQKDTLVLGALSVIGMSIAAAKGHVSVSKIINSISATKVNKNNFIRYKAPEGQLTEFQQLARDLGYDLSVVIRDGEINPLGVSKLDEDFLRILLEKGQNGNIEGKIKKLEEENIFLMKYLQTVVDIPEDKQAQLVRQIDELLAAQAKRKSGRDWRRNDGEYTTRRMESYYTDKALRAIDEKGMDINGFKDLQEILKRVKSKCPTSRTIPEAQSILDATFHGQYQIQQLLGVGSIAESYLAKDKDGKEVVIKIVKQHFLDSDKIATDRAKIMQKIEFRATDDRSFFDSKQTIRTTQRKQYDINQTENMYKVWGEEINLEEEARSAIEIGKQASAFQPVRVIDSKPHIFIMEKAAGYQLDSSRFAREWKAANLTEADFKNFVENYVKVYCEQLFALPRRGNKVVQSDPHGGNILVDIAKIKDIKNGANPITIIDYGNTTKTSPTQAITNLFNHLDYLIGNTDSIAEAMLQGANLGGKSRRAVKEKLSRELREVIYNSDTKIEVDNPVKIFSTVNSFCLNFMQKENIIPNASHINQMKAEETYIISNLGCLLNIANSCGYDLSRAIDRDAIIKQLVSSMGTAIQDAMKINGLLTAKEIAKRYKFAANNPEDTLSCLGINFGLV